MAMVMITKSFNKKLEVDAYVNQNGIKREDIVTTYQDLDGTYVLVYYGE